MMEVVKDVVGGVDREEGGRVRVVEEWDEGWVEKGGRWGSGRGGGEILGGFD